MTDWKRIKPVDDSRCAMRPTAKGWEATDSLNEKTDVKKPYVINALLTFSASYDSYGTREEIEEQCQRLRETLLNHIFDYLPKEEWQQTPLEHGSSAEVKTEVIECEEDEE